MATSRLGEPADLKDEFEEINVPVIQLRKTILVLSGILVIFLSYFFVVSSARFLVLALDHFNENDVLNFWFVFSSVGLCLFIVIVSTVMLYFSGLKRVNEIEYWKIKPGHTLLIFSGTFILALINAWLTRVINQSFNHTSYTFYHQYTLSDYVLILLSLIAIICLIALYKKYNRSVMPYDENSESNEASQLIENMESIDLKVDSYSWENNMLQMNFHLKEFKGIGLSEEEVDVVLRMRFGGNSLKSNQFKIEDNHGRSMNSIMLVYSGVLVYFFFFFLLDSSARIVISSLQYYVDDPRLNMRRTCSFVITFQLYIFLFTAALYFLDKNIVKRIRDLHFKPSHTLWLLFSTILLAILAVVFSRYR